MPDAFQKPTDSELEILQVLWQHGPSSVRFVNDQLNQKREVGYTTTLKMMQIMLEKDLLTRDTSKRTHIYEPKVNEGHVQSHLLSRFLESTFRGSASRLVLQLLDNHRASRAELSEIKAMIQKLENDQNR